MAQVTRGGLRLDTPERTQFELVPSSLDELLPADHKVRAIWRFVESLDLGPWLGLIKAVEGGAGRPAIDPQSFANETCPFAGCAAASPSITTR
jgi:hypothetical protein